MARMPAARGRISEDAPLSKHTWFRVGGPADVLFRPADLDDLCFFLKHLPFDIPVHVLGVGSNSLIRDGGLRGVVIRLLGPFADISVDGNRIRAGAGALDVNVAKVAARNGLAGLEFLSGIPGTVGGALRMNAGAYGSETRNVLIAATAVDRDGTFTPSRQKTWDTATAPPPHRRTGFSSRPSFRQSRGTAPKSMPGSPKSRKAAPPASRSEAGPAGRLSRIRAAWIRPDRRPGN